MRWFVFLYAAFFLNSCTEEERFQHLIGRDVSALQVQNLAGEPAVLGVFKGQPVILNIWATWCPPCVKELPSLNQLAENGDVLVVTIATDRTAESVRNFLKKHQLDSFETWFDAFGKQTYAGVLEAQKLPQTYLIGRDMHIKAVVAGDEDWTSPEMMQLIRDKILS